MPDTSPILALPYILPSQAQKHVTHNEALQLLDAIVQLVVISADQTEPPVNPVTGSRYIVASGGTGSWSGRDGMITVASASGWLFYGAQTGWRADDLSTGGQIRFNGTGWDAVAPVLEGLEQLGVGTSADATNRLAVSGPATLLTHEGADHQLKINKAQTTDTASLLFQTGWSGRAEMGITGSDDFGIKVSADGVDFKQALVLDRDSGAVKAPGNPAFTAFTSGSWLNISTPHTDLVFNTPVLNRGGHYDPATSQFTAPVDGFYCFLLNGFLGSTTNGRVCFAINGETQLLQMQVLSGAGSLSYSAVLNLSAGQYVTCRTGNVNTALNYSQTHTAFSGWLIS